HSRGECPDELAGRGAGHRSPRCRLSVRLHHAHLEHAVALEGNLASIADDAPDDDRRQGSRHTHSGGRPAGLVAAANEANRFPGHRHGKPSVISALHEVSIGTRGVKLEPGTCLRTTDERGFRETPARRASTLYMSPAAR